VQQRSSGSDRTARSGATRCANEADDFLGHGSPKMVVLVCAEERQKALLRNEARRFAPQHRQAAGTAEMEKGEHPVIASALDCSPIKFKTASGDATSPTVTMPAAAATTPNLGNAARLFGALRNRQVVSRVDQQRDAPCPSASPDVAVGGKYHVEVGRLALRNRH